MASRAAFDAAYGAVPLGSTVATVLDTNTTLPPVSRSDGMTARTSSTLDKTCSWNNREYSSSGVSTADFPREAAPALPTTTDTGPCVRSEEHTSELQSREKLVCRLLLEKKKS